MAFIDCHDDIEIKVLFARAMNQFGEDHCCELSKQIGNEDETSCPTIYGLELVQ